MAKLAFEIIRGSNLFVEGHNTALAFESAMLPKPSENYEDFTPGGGNGAIAIPTHREAIELTFKTKGLQSDVLTMFNTPFGLRRKVTFFGALVNEYAATAGERVRQVTATVYGRLNVEINEDKRDAIGGTDYTLKSIAKYVLEIGDQPIYRFNIELGGWVTDSGQSAEIAQAIGLNG